MEVHILSVRSKYILRHLLAYPYDCFGNIGQKKNDVKFDRQTLQASILKKNLLEMRLEYKIYNF